MTSMTVKEFALELKLPVKTLLAQLRAAGVSKDAENDVLSDADKSRLLDSLRIERTQTSQRKITINRKEKSVIKQTDASGRAHTIQVEVRKKRVFMKNPQIQAEEEAKIEQAAREEAARREAEAKRQAEEEARRKAEEERRAAEEAARREREEAERRAAALLGQLAVDAVAGDAQRQRADLRLIVTEVAAVALDEELAVGPPEAEKSHSAAVLGDLDGGGAALEADGLCLFVGDVVAAVLFGKAAPGHQLDVVAVLLADDALVVELVDGAFDADDVIFNG